MAALGRLWYKAWIDVPRDPQTRFDGKTVVVTGANTGIGLEAAVKVVQLGAEKVIIGVRSEKKGEIAKEVIERRTNSTGVVLVEHLDMSDYDSVKGFADRLSKLSRLDAVILNAGVHPAKFSTSKHGWVEVLQVNTLSTTYLALLLLPVLQQTASKSGGAHLEVVGSGLWPFAKIDEEHKSKADILESYNNAQDYNDRVYYPLSKLFSYSACKTIAAHLGSDSNVVVTNVCPGSVATDLARDYATSIGMRVMLNIFRFFQRTPEQGSRTLVRGITVGKEAHGRFWQHDRVQPDGGLLAGDDAEQFREQLWRNIIDALQKDIPDIQSQIIKCW